MAERAHFCCFVKSISFSTYKNNKKKSYSYFMSNKIWANNQFVRINQVPIHRIIIKTTMQKPFSQINRLAFYYIPLFNNIFILLYLDI